MNLDFTLIETGLFILYLIITLIIWNKALKVNKQKSTNFVSKANNNFVSFLLTLPLILFFNKVSFTEVSLRDISLYAFPIFVFIYLFYLLFYYTNTKGK